MTKRLAVLLCAAAAFQGAPVLAQENWPQRPVRIIAPFGVGGTADIVSRFVADHLAQAFRQQFIVENRTGAGGAIGAQAIARAEPDGYTLGVTNLTTMSLVPVIQPKTPYHPIKDFTHIAYIAGAPVMLAVHPSTKVKTVAEFVEYAKAAGRPLTFASAGVGSDGHVMGEAIAAALKISVSHVPYRSTAQGLADAAGGHVVFSTLTSASTSNFVRAGTLHPLAVTSAQRLADWPDVPTLRELGHPALVSSTWYALSAPAGFPRPVAARLHAELSTFLARPEVQKQLSRYGLLPEPMSMEAFNRFVANEGARWKPMIEAANLAGRE
jgi:tripartite-type tricarboxylate transporter receptor subunit TctC